MTMMIFSLLVEKKTNNGSNGSRRDPFASLFSNFGFAGFDNDDFFSSPFDRMSGRMNMNNFGGGGGGPFTSVSSSTIIKNGKKVTVTKTTVGNPDGTSRTEVQETVVDEGGNRKENRYIEGDRQNQEPKQLYIENGVGKERKRSKDKKYEKVLYDGNPTYGGSTYKTPSMNTGFNNGSYSSSKYSNDSDVRNGTKEYKYTKKRWYKQFGCNFVWFQVVQCIWHDICTNSIRTHRYK